MGRSRVKRTQTCTDTDNGCLRLSVDTVQTQTSVKSKTQTQIQTQTKLFCKPQTQIQTQTRLFSKSQTQIQTQTTVFQKNADMSADTDKPQTCVSA